MIGRWQEDRGKRRRGREKRRCKDDAPPLAAAIAADDAIRERKWAWLGNCVNTVESPVMRCNEQQRGAAAEGFEVEHSAFSCRCLGLWRRRRRCLRTPTSSIRAVLRVVREARCRLTKKLTSFPIKECMCCGGFCFSATAAFSCPHLDERRPSSSRRNEPGRQSLRAAPPPWLLDGPKSRPNKTLLLRSFRFYNQVADRPPLSNVGRL